MQRACLVKEDISGGSMTEKRKPNSDRIKLAGTPDLFLLPLSSIPSLRDPSKTKFQILNRQKRRNLL